MGQALYRKWRPQTFDDVVGQEHIVQTLRYALRTDHIHHAYLLAGPRGTGKTTTARLIAKAVNCLSPSEERPCNHCEICNAINAGRLMDLIEIDAASNTGVDNIRDLLEKVGYRPTQAAYKVYVVDEVHMLSTQAFNALLKTLEEPPEHVIFVLATTEVHKIPETILSRCQRFEFRRIPLDILVQQLEKIADAEGVAVEPEAFELIARTATGSMRDAISLFDQMAAGESITADYVRLMLGAERREVVRALLAAWVDGDLTAGLNVINGAVDGGADPRQLARQIADFLRGLLLIRLGAGQTWTDPTAEERAVFTEMARKADPDRLVEAVRLFSDVAAKQRTGWQPQLPLELAFVEAVLDTAGAPQTPAIPGTTATTKAVTETAGATPARSLVREAPVDASPARPRSRPGSAPRSAADVVPSGSTKGTTESNHVVPQASEPPTSAPASTGTVTALDEAALSSIQANWSEVIKQVEPVMLGALLRDASVGGVDQEGRIVLAFQHSFHCEKVAQEPNLRKVEDILSRSLGQIVTLHCLLAENWSPPGTSGRASTGTSTKRGSSAVPVEEDELIRRAQEELGAVARVNK